MSLLGLGVIGSSAKENEHRLPLHPDHLPGLDADLRAQITLEHGYGEKFGVSDESLADHVNGFASREQLLAESDVVLLPKPQLADVAALSPGQTLWGWPHCVQDSELTQVAIDQRLTLIAFEAMNHWTRDGTVGLHVFHKNNELAGYCSVLHALEIAGLTGDFGRRLSAVVIGFGATARGAVTALNAHGVHEVAVLTNRGVAAVGAPIHSVRIRQFDHEPDGARLSHVTTERGREPLPAYLAENDIVVNCTLQDPAHPLVYLATEDLAAFRPGSVIVDVSCDLEMGFTWARPTSFDEPTFEVGDHVLYYAVDHTPSYLWNSATWENSHALIPFLRPV
ncbi:N(5)-(carboxyethyl)ornithine synthase, partial [Nocardioides sp.]|uniref:N(5)-(carboxyethyl)ornithine synthase n=1 Tax=Nocardioides sp. TaxID=35761 RepID=UPI002B266A02